MFIPVELQAVLIDFSCCPLFLGLQHSQLIVIVNVLPVRRSKFISSTHPGTTQPGLSSLVILLAWERLSGMESGQVYRMVLKFDVDRKPLKFHAQLLTKPVVEPWEERFSFHNSDGSWQLLDRSSLPVATRTHVSAIPGWTNTELEDQHHQ
jgi:hypothetical protein